jgi:biotin carboxyl carrier protein
MTRSRTSPHRFSLEVLLEGQLEKVSVQPSGSGLQVFLHNQWVDMDVAKISDSVYSLIFNGQSHHAVISDVDEVLEIVADGISFQATVLDSRQLRSDPSSSGNRTGPSPVLAPMPGKIVRILVAVGDSVREGQGVVVIEAMKMQNELKTTKAGTVEQVNVVENQTVNAGESLVVVH